MVLKPRAAEWAHSTPADAARTTSTGRKRAQPCSPFAAPSLLRGSTTRCNGFEPTAAVIDASVHFVCDSGDKNGRWQCQTRRSPRLRACISQEGHCFCDGAPYTHATLPAKPPHTRTTHLDRIRGPHWDGRSPCHQQSARRSVATAHDKSATTANPSNTASVHTRPNQQKNVGMLHSADVGVAPQPRHSIAAHPQPAHHAAKTNKPATAASATTDGTAQAHAAPNNPTKQRDVECGSRRGKKNCPDVATHRAMPPKRHRARGVGGCCCRSA